MATDEKWRKAAWDLFGYKLGCQNNSEEVSAALQRMWELLDDNRDVQITVRERVEDADVIESAPSGAIHLPPP